MLGADGNIDTEIFLIELEEEILPRTNRYNPLNPPKNINKLRIVLLCEKLGVKSIFPLNFIYSDHVYVDI